MTTSRPDRRSTGLLHWIFPAMLAVTALNVIVTDRDLTQSFAQLQVVAEPARPAVVAWLQRAVSLLLLIASVEQVANHLALGLRTPSPLLLGAFVLYWVGSTGAPAFFGAHPQVSHELLYAPAAGIAICLATAPERDRILRTARDALFLLMLAGVLIIPLRLHMVLDTSYTAGLVPGLPRFGGLTAHPVTQGLLAQMALLLLAGCPYERRWLRRSAWALGLGVLLLAQSKTAWVAFAACGAAMWTVMHGRAFWQRVSDPRGGGFGIVMCALAALAVVASLLAMLLGDIGGRLGDFLSTDQGAQLVSMTGRDRIWAAAAQEWAAHPVFGYGLSLWDAAYRASIGMPNATHAHNQFMDDAARAGTVGAVALVLYALVLMVLSIRYAVRSGGLSLALFIAVALRAISEVPLSLMGYGTELFTHLLLLVTLAACAGTVPVRQRRYAPLRYGVAG